MDKEGQWSLSPAFDVMYSYNPSGIWTASHQMSLAGKRDGFTPDDLRAVAKTASMMLGRAEAIATEVVAAVSRWEEFASQAGVVPKQINQIANTHRLNLSGVRR
jgi:serine/threonine-protein kinase HipA